MARVQFRPSVRLVLKSVLFITLCWLILYINIQREQNVESKSTKKSHEKRKPEISHFSDLYTESLETKIERIGICHKLNESGLNLKTIYLPNVDNTQKIEVVKSACSKLKQEMQEYFRTQEVKVNPFTHSFLVTAENGCTTKTDMVVMVHSLHTYSDRRKAIRETWGGAIQDMEWPGGIPLYADDIKLVFVLGLHKDPEEEKKLAQESAFFGDIVQGDFYEDYHNMTLKSLLGLKWMSEYCDGAKYLVKSDDDMIINFPHLTKVLRETNMTWSVIGISILMISSP